MRRELLQVLPHERLAAGEAELEHAELARLGEDPLPVLGGDLALGPDQLERIGAVGAVERTAMGQLRQQRGRTFGRSWISSLSARCDRYSVTSAVTSVW